MTPHLDGAPLVISLAFGIGMLVWLALAITGTAVYALAACAGLWSWVRKIGA